ncbi:MAG: adenylate/guanylate cyclase domain-containing protein, partial [Candidatus Latescibacterota bacterium]
MLRLLRRRWTAVLLVGVVAIGASWLVTRTAPLEALEGQALDWRFLFRGPQGDPSPRVAVVLVTEESGLPYRSPIPRRHLAAVVEHLAEARLVGLDILLDQPSFDTDGDNLLKDALRRHGRVVAVSYLERGQEHLPESSFGSVLLDHGYATFATGSGEEVVRAGSLWWPGPGGRSLSLVGSLYAHLQGWDTTALRAGAPAPLAGDRILINYSGPSGRVYQRLEGLAGGLVVCPSHLVAAGVYPPGFFAGRVVLVGSGLDDAPDRYRTPFFSAAYGYEKTHGAEIHAQFLRTLVDAEPLREWGGPGWWLLVLCLCVALAAAVLLGGALQGAAVTVALILALHGAAFALFSLRGVVMPLVAPSLAVLLAYGLATGVHALTEGREKRQVRHLFEKYLAPGVVEELLRDPARWRLGGQSMEITVLFADLEGFTPLTEGLEPHALVGLINEFLTEMSRAIWDQGGTIDKYEGDLIMAFFGAPVPQPDHAARACRAALRMQARMAELRP